jgi:hydroxymethylbilane synthase
MATPQQAPADYSRSIVNVGTRRSQLAIAQVDMIIARLQTIAPGLEYKMRIVSTMADENQAKPFQDFNSKSIWTEELEQMLVGNELDVIVHCLKGASPQQYPLASLQVLTL